MRHSGNIGSLFAFGAWRRGWMAALLLVGAMAGRAAGCGLSWSEPRSHFDGVDSEGHVMLVEKLGEIELESGAGEAPAKRLPVYAMFGSEFTGVSPYVGYGWKLPILETRVVQADENTFKMEEPAGWYRMFWRDKKEPRLLTGGGGWKGWIEGDKITAWADCGAKLVFRRGKIETMELNGRRLAYVYENGVATEIREGGRTLLRVRKDAKTGEVNGLVFAGGKEAGIELGDRPRVEMINGKPVVGRMERALGRVERTDGATDGIEYGISQGLVPSITSWKRKISWDPSTGMVVSEGAWVYSIRQEDSGAIRIARSEPGTARTESVSVSHSESDIRDADGWRVITKRFSSGKCAGREREREEIAPSGRITKTKFSYDEECRTLRVAVTTLENDRTIQSHVLSFQNTKTK